jgi:hypothetical protein
VIPLPEGVVVAAGAGDESAQWQLREDLVAAMIEATASNGHVRRQLERLGLKIPQSKTHRRDPRLPDLLSLTELGARLVERIAEVGWEPRQLDKVLLLMRQGTSGDAAIERVARWTVRSIAEQEDSLVFVRKAVERGVRLAATAGEIEEVIGVGFRISDRVTTRVEEAVALNLIGKPIRTKQLRETLVVFTPMAKTAKGRQFDIVFRRPFIGPPASVSDLIRNAGDPWRELTQLRKRREEVQHIARTEIQPLVPKRRKGRGTISEILALPVEEVKRIARQLAQVVGHPLERAVFLSGMYATLSECNLETIARMNDPTNPFRRRSENDNQDDPSEVVG